MAKKYKVKTAAVFDGQPVGSVIELDEATAKKYEALKYLEIIEEAKQAKQSKPKPKAKTTKKSTTKKKDE